MKKGLVDFLAWMEVHAGTVMEVSKLKSINSKASGILKGESFVGVANLRYVVDNSLILHMQFPYMHTSIDWMLNKKKRRDLVDKNLKLYL
jgi:hypothetical protein